MFDTIKEAGQGVFLSFLAAQDYAAGAVLGLFNEEWGDAAPLTAAGVEWIRSSEEGREFDEERWKRSAEGGLALIEQAAEETTAEVETIAKVGGVGLAIVAGVVLVLAAVIYLPKPRA
mgnify:CR=1 FL=1